MKNNSKQEQKLDFLEKFLQQAVFDGWNKKSFENTSEIIFNNADYGYGLFPNDIEDLLILFSQKIDSELMDYINQNKMSDLRIHEKISYLIHARLLLIAPYKLAIKRLLKSPLDIASNALTAINLTWHNADNFWNMINDKSTDFNYYTKRGILSVIYIKTLNFWVDDQSENLKNTQEYLENQMANTLKIGKCKKKIVTGIENIAKLPFIRLLTKKF